MPTAEKIAEVEELTEILKRSKGIYLADFTGLNVPRVTALRKKLRDESVAFRVVKNRLALRAFEAAGIDGITDQLQGPTGLVSTEDDAALPARLLSEFARDADGKPRVKAGLLEGRVFGEAELEALAKLPGREVLLGQVVTAIASPITGLVFTLNGLLTKFVRTLHAVAEQRRETGDAPAAAEESSETGADEGADTPAPEAEAPAAPEAAADAAPEAASEASSGDTDAADDAASTENA